MIKVLFSQILFQLIRINDKHQIIINKGSMDGIELGAAIADSKGIIGHIFRDQVLASEVLLISDPEHGIPIKSCKKWT